VQFEDLQESYLQHRRVLSGTGGQETRVRGAEEGPALADPSLAGPVEAKEGGGSGLKDFQQIPFELHTLQVCHHIFQPGLPYSAQGYCLPCIWTSAARLARSSMQITALPRLLSLNLCSLCTCTQVDDIGFKWRSSDAFPCSSRSLPPPCAVSPGPPVCYLFVWDLVAAA